MDFHICDQSFSGKRCRTRFNSWQIERLEKIFITTTHYPDAKQIESLSNETGIPVSKMQIWFQNRRAKWRKHSRLRNFGGLASVTQTEFVPAPNEKDTIKSFNCIENPNENFHFKKEKAAIDLSIGKSFASFKTPLRPPYSCSAICLIPSAICNKPITSTTTTSYKKSGQELESYFSNHMNAFEYVQENITEFALNNTTNNTTTTLCHSTVGLRSLTSSK